MINILALKMGLSALEGELGSGFVRVRVVARQVFDQTLERIGFVPLVPGSGTTSGETRLEYIDTDRVEMNVKDWNKVNVNDSNSELLHHVKNFWNTPNLQNNRIQPSEK